MSRKLKGHQLNVFQKACESERLKCLPHKVHSHSHSLSSTVPLHCSAGFFFLFISLFFSFLLCRAEVCLWLLTSRRATMTTSIILKLLKFCCSSGTCTLYNQFMSRARHSISLARSLIRIRVTPWLVEIYISLFIRWEDGLEVSSFFVIQSH